MHTKLLLQNLRGWPYSHDNFIQSLNGLEQLVKRNYPDLEIMCLEEFIPGYRLMYLNRLKRIFPDFIPILPKFFDESNYRSAISVVLIKQGIICVENRISIACDSPYSYLYNLLNLSKNGEAFYLYNGHSIQLSNGNKPTNYQIERLCKHNAMSEGVIGKLKELQNKHVIAAADWNEDISGPSLQILSAMFPDTFDEKLSKWKNTYVTPQGVNKRYDMVLSNIGGASQINPEPYIMQWSDHTAVYYEV